jgi:caffeoyl-CoA O-methyltransferase
MKWRISYWSITKQIHWHPISDIGNKIVKLMLLINEDAEQYAKLHTSPLEDLLAEIENFTLAHHAQPHMLSGHVQGRFLQFISTMICPARILEIGTFTGFSALCLAKGLQENGCLHTIELRAGDADTAQEFFNKAEAQNKIILHRGDARDIIPTLHEAWDLVFIDADKTGYIDYYELTLPMVRKGGFLLADNVLFHGEVLKQEITGKNAKAIDAFNNHVANDQRTRQVMLTVRDGLMLIQKK